MPDECNHSETEKLLDEIMTALGEIARCSDNSPWEIESLQRDIEKLGDTKVKDILPKLQEILSSIHRNQFVLADKFRQIFMATQDFPHSEEGPIAELIKLRDQATKRVDESIVRGRPSNLKYFILSQDTIVVAHEARLMGERISNEEILKRIQDRLG